LPTQINSLLALTKQMVLSLGNRCFCPSVTDNFIRVNPETEGTDVFLFTEIKGCQQNPLDIYIYIPKNASAQVMNKITISGTRKAAVHE
jgi:hypothetical protein